MSRFNRAAAIASSMDERFPRRRGHCTACAKPVQPPRQNWCSKACVDAYLSLARTDRTRRILWARDPHCALCRHPVWVCYHEGDLGYEPIPSDQRGGAPYITKRPIGFRLVREFGWRWVRERNREPHERLCELDHTVPLVEGGKHDWPNLRLLCLPCHKAETAALAARRARLRRTVGEVSP